MSLRKTARFYRQYQKLEPQYVPNPRFECNFIQSHFRPVERPGFYVLEEFDPNIQNPVITEWPSNE